MAIEHEDPATHNARYKPRKKTILGVGVLLFIGVCALAMLFCNFRFENATQQILNQRREAMQTALDKGLDAIRVWRNELVEQANYVSASEMFRLFVQDTGSLTASELEALSSPDSLSSSDENVRAMAEQLTYIQDLLKDFTKRRAWTDARILLPNGVVMVEPPFSPPLDQNQISLARSVTDSGKAMFGQVRKTANGLVMDMADPLFDVLGSSEQKVVAVLLLSVPMEKPLTGFLSRLGEQTETLYPRILNKSGENYTVIYSSGGKIELEEYQGSSGPLEALPFMERVALNGREQVYSIGGLLPILEWLYALEEPAEKVDSIIRTQKNQIYGLGILASVGLALLGAWLWGGYVSRRHEADAIRYEKLYNTIRNQKMLLDSVNASFEAGIALIDQYGRVQMCNPAFKTICGDKKDIQPGTPLVECLYSKCAIQLLEDIKRVTDLGKSASEELTIPQVIAGQSQDRLFRVTLYPYDEEKGKSNQGAVAIFQDITEFRRKALAEKKKAEDARERQAALIRAFVRAIESVDPNLVGHSQKMAALSNLLASELQLTEEEKETLRLAATLSQVGKIYVPRELLTKKEKLTPEELREVRRAPEHADKILNELRFDLPVRETVSLINEKVDGSGKPRGLSGDEISLAGRALAVVNAFIAMTSPRAWRKDGGMSPQEAIKQLRRDPGFDPGVVDALSQLSPTEVTAILRENGETPNPATPAQ